MAEPIVLKEYEKIAIQNCDLEKLQKFLECKNLTSALKVTYNSVIAKSWVGVIKYKNSHFQILPKLICNKDDKESIIKNLIFMLSYTKKLDIKTSEETLLLSTRNPFIETLIREYARSLFECLKCSTPKRYVRQENNLNYLKGKIKFSENIRYNCANRVKFYCEFDEFSENNLLNQLFLFVSTCLYNISNDNYNKKTLKFIINHYSEVQFVRFDKFQAGKIKLSRSQELFKKPFNLAKMFIEQTSVNLSKNKFENITLIWDMNKLFEEFIFEVMKRHHSRYGWSYTSQKGKKLLKNNLNKKRNTFVDILAQKKNTKEKIIIDTKYKKLENDNDFANADIYQVSTYCLLHNTNRAILLYPQWGNEKPALPPQELNSDKENIKIDIKTINLKYDDLKAHISVIQKEIEEILN